MSSKRTIGKYEVIDRMGRGGMAEVYRAYHANLDRFVAIKVLHAFLADDPEFRTRFSGEARNIARLKHPHIVQVYDFDFDEEVENYFMVMELVDGPTLKELLTGRRDKGDAFSLSETLRIVRQAASALSYAHKDGMIHRDVKPANLMIDKDDRLVLTDFGIAKMMSTPQSTLTGGMVGTPAYMSPEQGTGDLGDERSDLYALGIIMYEMLTGELPYFADTPLGVIMKHANEPVPSVSESRPHLPKSVDTIVKKLMAKLPENRYQTADELIVDIDKFISALRRSSSAITSTNVRRKTEPKKPEPVASTTSTPDNASLSNDIHSSQMRLKSVLEDAQIRRTQNIKIQKEKKSSIPKILWLFLIFIILGMGGYFVGVSTGNIPSVGALLNPTSTPSPTITPSPSSTATLTVTPTATETNTPTATPSQTPTNTPTATDTATNTPSVTPSATPTLTHTPSPTFTPSQTPTLTSTPTITPTPSPTNSPIPSATPNFTLTIAVAQTATISACVFDYAIVEQDPLDGEEGGFYATETQYTRSITLLNIGSCEWGPNTSLTFIDGNNLNIGPRVFIRETVSPASEYVLVIETTLPSRGGLLESTWQLRTPGQIPIGEPLEINVQVFDPGPGG